MRSLVEPEAGKALIRPKVRSESSLSDGNLLAMVSDGNQDAFEELYRRHNSRLYNFVLRLTGDRTSADDVLQNVFIAVWKGASSFRNGASVKTWLYSIAHKQSVSLIRHQSKVVEAPLDESYVKESSSEPGLVLIWRSKQLVEALDLLSPDHRATIELVFVDDLSYKEVARIMDCPVGTVKSRISYALRRLNGLLLQKGVDG